MKKFLTTGILALTLAALSTQDAPAWLNWKFGVGMNMGWQSGGNNTLWGLFRNGQPPAPDICCGGGPGGVFFRPARPRSGPASGSPPPSGYPSSLEHSVNRLTRSRQQLRTRGEPTTRWLTTPTTAIRTTTTVTVANPPRHPTGRAPWPGL